MSTDRTISFSRLRWDSGVRGLSSCLRPSPEPNSIVSVVPLNVSAPTFKDRDPLQILLGKLATADCCHEKLNFVLKTNKIAGELRGI